MVKLTWDDIVIQNISHDDFVQWMANWTGLIVGRVAPAFMNKFGVWFLRRPEGPVDVLDILTGGVARVAETYDGLISAASDPAWQEHYLRSKLVYELHVAGVIAGPGQCYGAVPHPAIGGTNPMVATTIDPRAVMTMPIGAWQSICAQILRGPAA
jgi:hypothetical protein